MDYRVDFLGEDQISAAWFTATDDAAALKAAMNLYNARAVFRGFELWERSRLVYTAPAQTPV